MITEEICDLGECDHSPLYPPRNKHTGEIVFTEKWKEWMSKRGNLIDDDGSSNFMLQTVIGYMAGTQLVQRHATVAASVIKWFGTNCGLAFIDEAKRLEASMSHGHGFLAAWAIDNRRESWLNSGIRTLEHILATDEDRHNGQVRYKPDLSADDCEVAERVVYWLSTEKGKQFLAECETEIKKRATAEKIAECVTRNDYRMLKFYLKDIPD
jgi:hypothetical protein